MPSSLENIPKYFDFRVGTGIPSANVPRYSSTQRISIRKNRERCHFVGQKLQRKALSQIQPNLMA